MTTYQGITIAEWKLLFYSLFGSIVVLLLFVVAAFLLWFLIIQRTNKKENKRIQKLKEQAATDEKARGKLEKLQRKRERKKTRDKPKLIREIAFLLLPLGLGILLLYAAVPTLIDYIKKDYVVYSGNFTVEISYNGRFISEEITLEDGTTLEGTAGLHGDDTCGTVIYAKRSKMALGAKSDSQE